MTGTRPVPAPPPERQRPGELLGLGTWLFGWDTPEQEARHLMAKALDHGITYFDTANNYGDGESERIVGSFLRTRRDQVVLGTKVYAPFGPDPADRGLSGQAVRRAVDGCLRRLDTDRIDVLHLHRPDPDVPAAETAGVLAELVRAGKVLRVATSTFKGQDIDAIQTALRREGVATAVTDQAPYSLLERQVESAAGAALRAWGMSVMAWSPLGEGLLTGKYTGSTGAGRLRRWNVLPQRRFQRGVATAERFGRLAADLGLALPQLALAWLVRRPLVSSLLIGARTVDQFDTYLDGVSTELPPGADVRIDAILPPGQTVLEHYAT
ncbi:aldo/keto reductase [Streptomyces sp. NPDC048751]|uniref:aldo/keto reductase n=1 Tax=Streptomyces sp. NPDC048751 TaxID=3365591 RepID=UPI00371B7464